MSSPELATEDLLPLSIDAMGVEYVLSDIEADRDWLHHLTSSISSPKTLPVFGPGDGCRPQHHLHFSHGARTDLVVCTKVCSRVMSRQ